MESGPYSNIVEYLPGFLGETLAQLLFNKLTNENFWAQKSVHIFGKLIPQPRLVHYVGARPYAYSGLELPAASWPDYLLPIRSMVGDHTQTRFDAALLNLYRDGQDSMGAHSDDEKGLGPVIASLSIGASRSFKIAHKREPSLKTKITLEHGSLLVMKKGMQENWKHEVPKTKKQVGPRINITMRHVFGE